ncbi:MAG: biopolymer transporter ExbD [Bdellovibrionales bacterium RIFOXYB1_FULL_37_110]|nr:MAG: biopolymer transporter ExbD [Bdellovibrionales bacterium RIFOXYA1_FULL_38_20]OFZ52532.1 MAG: biopolymer transporter ExbD [Bdellovibrionales bacterium RIFOXYC1_FULL_37_79]OFZ55585.1 MAG: biopolymer transporter ExbD [Bdellovibrionales bacterium RIFOXYB2_FULL_36_6]OFZ59734.1 MAG: biopolymer transporter ExbD [Bdellovibrionales bacterium RIFOXYB1_FULL_37_110]OFZ63545.1 MAG: biopolymer transporter ExbD [Bdellovibrionales bacterium RIFOXYD1_FULL_36_51]
MKKRSRESLSPELTPLIDVVFLLLIFFMVSTVFKKNELALLMSLPEASKDNSVSQVKNVHYLELTSDRLAYNGKEVTIDELKNHLASITNKTEPVELRVDKNVIYDKVINILDMLKNSKLHNLSLITNQK